MKKFIMLLVCVVGLFASDATVEIVKRLERLPVVALQDATADDVDAGLKRRFFQMLIGDLKVSANFDVLDEYTKSTYGGDYRLHHTSTKTPDLVLRYKLEYSWGGEILARVKVFNGGTGTLRSERSYKIAQPERYPFLAHRMAVEFNDGLGLPSIAWMERFIIFSKYTTPKQSEIVLADYTLTFQQTVVSGGLNIFPKWADARQSGYYYSDYTAKVPTLYHVNLSSGQKTKIAQSEGMMMVSDVSQDGTRLLLTMAPSDQPDVYMYNTQTKHLERLTTYSGIDVSAGFIDDERRIVFVSDRLGYPNIFSKTIGQSSVEQMVYHGRNNNSVSAFGRYMVYSSREKSSEFGSGTFNLYLISTQTDYIRQLTATGKNLFPRFSNDGESVLFIKEYGAQSALGVIRLGANKSFHFPLKAGHIQSIDW
ncbi:Tol-Pal system protein TolB [Sulfurospirillum sp. T05]|uniref:Tol-Pal system protein TolB n=1 Tax=Sulfurospirillum tamanense TaxID=2813362 RepID=A0ABS2WPQ7_9BACT|nr:Tol-Pal system protein TolB [Sulfurospirillum tamanensis]MBN2963687.1 Tol-Pal system protein TolB [Sulfurospirillum tamanensis]